VAAITARSIIARNILVTALVCSTMTEAATSITIGWSV